MSAEVHRMGTCGAVQGSFLFLRLAALSLLEDSWGSWHFPGAKKEKDILGIILGPKS